MDFYCAQIETTMKSVVDCVSLRIRKRKAGITDYAPCTICGAREVNEMEFRKLKAQEIAAQHAEQTVKTITGGMGGSSGAPAATDIPKEVAVEKKEAGTGVQTAGKKCCIEGCKSKSVKDERCTRHFREKHGRAPFEKENQKTESGKDPQSSMPSGGETQSAGGVRDPKTRALDTLFTLSRMIDGQIRMMATEERLDIATLGDARDTLGALMLQAVQK